MTRGKIDPLIAAAEQRGVMRIDDAVNTPANANDRITSGCLTAVDVFNAYPVPPDPGDSGSTQEERAYYKAAIRRLEETVKELCRAQMTLPRMKDFK